MAVSLDSPLISHTLSSRLNPPRSVGVAGAVVTALARTVFKVALVYLAYLTISEFGGWVKEGGDTDPSDDRSDSTGIFGVVGRTSYLRLKVWSRSFLSLLSTPFKSVIPEVNHYWRLSWGVLAKYRDRYRYLNRDRGTPLSIQGDDWGVATLQSKQSIGGDGGRYVKYTFGLPQGKTLPVGMAQQVKVCCLDGGDNVVKGNFYPSSPRHTKGHFEIVGTKGTPEDGGVWGKEKADLDRTMWEEIDVGDEVAIKPGKSTLEYRGEALPVTDIVYICNGLGVIPMIGQLTEVLNSPSSSVSTCTVVWVNERSSEFYGPAYKELEDEFYKHNRKLDVSCCLERDVYGGSLGENEEVEKSTPEYGEGTMAVVAGPDYFVKKVNLYLQQRGYPANCICALG
ncbi:hypothetical protein TrCOL_g338 [Triparma columacea]|uniref:Uncharacterized protein n=1 Tax=Triparma columacea TaxID=722753 RepID=A0A9W7L995_9STRA|nr:hypothetical protein TrCOL_g338 [Triparma columacea]